MKNWKTLLGGLVAGLPVAISGIDEAIKAGTIDTTSIGKFALGIGLVLLGIFAKDKNVTGGTKQQ